MRLGILLLFLNLCNLFLLAQTNTKILPKSFSLKESMATSIPVVEMPIFDLQQVVVDNEQNLKNGTGMYMFGFEHNVSISIFDSGEWLSLNSKGKICRLKVESENAVSINLIFNDFFLEEGSYVHIYTEDKRAVDGAYSYLNNNKDNVLGTDIIMGDKIIIEYFEPMNSHSLSRLNLGMVVHGVEDVTNWKTQLKVNESGGCNMDVICADGDLWRNEIKAVARIVNGGGLCSGTLVNNTSNNGIPYFLTANHCSPQSMSSAVFRFNYDSPICGSQSASNSQNATSNNLINGSSFKARNPNSDFGLILLNSTPPDSYNVFYAGWDNSGATPNSTVGIHHPHGDVKKISFDDNAPGLGNMGTAISNAEWKILAWDRNTTTEGGSSGSGLWNENHLIIGQLHGGQATCSNSVNDFYGKFSVSWDGTSSTNRLKDWLDPNSSGVTSITGFNPNASLNDVSLIAITYPLETNCGKTISPEVIIQNLGGDSLASLTFNYGINNELSTYNWVGSLASNDTLLIKLPSINIGDLSSYNLIIHATQPNHSIDGDTSSNHLSHQFINNSNCYAFPNPFSNALTINLEKSKVKEFPVEISITDIQGKIIWNVSYNTDKGNQLKLNTQSFSIGTYLLKIQYKEDNLVQKIVKF